MPSTLLNFSSPLVDIIYQFNERRMQSTGYIESLLRIVKPTLSSLYLNQNLRLVDDKLPGSSEMQLGGRCRRFDSYPSSYDTSYGQQVPFYTRLYSPIVTDPQQPYPDLKTLMTLCTTRTFITVSYTILLHWSSQLLLSYQMLSFERGKEQRVDEALCSPEMKQQ